MASEKGNMVNYRELIENIRNIVLNARGKIAQNINHELIATYWNIGKEIIEGEKIYKISSHSSRQLIISLSKHLTEEIGKGFSRANLFNMRIFYLEFPDVQTLSGHLNWSHYCELLIIEYKSDDN